VSNNGARCRVIIYKKLIEDQVTIASPMDIGGLKSPEYLALNPQGKMPLLVTDEITLPESDTICRYLLDRFSGSSPSFVPSTVAARARSDLLCRLHDMYVTTIQGALYKATPPFGIFGSRLEALAELRKQLIVLNNAADATGPYLAGEELSLADATVFPTMVFVAHMLPLFSADGAALDIKGVMGERLGQWYLDMQANDAVFKRVLRSLAALRISRGSRMSRGFPIPDARAARGLIPPLHISGAPGDPVRSRRLEQQRALEHDPPCRLSWPLFVSCLPPDAHALGLSGGVLCCRRMLPPCPDDARVTPQRIMLRVQTQDSGTRTPAPSSTRSSQRKSPRLSFLRTTRSCSLLSACQAHMSTQLRGESAGS